MKSARRATLLRAALMLALIVAPALFSAHVRAALNIEIFGAGSNQIPVAIAPFRAEDKLAQKITPIVAADLVRSGLFRMVDAGGAAPPFEPQDVNFGTWRARGAEALVIGTIAARPDGRYDVHFRLMDVAKQTQLAGFA